MSSDDEIISTGKGVLKLAADNITRSEEMLGEPFREAVYLLHNTKGNIVVCGMGKSGIIAKKIAATLSSTGTFSYFIHPSEAFHGDFGKIKPEDTILLLSHSGETDELLKLLSIVKKLQKDNKIITITAKSNSTLAAASDVVILTHVLRESHDDNFRHIPTTSTTVTLALGDAIAIALQKLKGFKEAHFFEFHPGGNIGSIAKEAGR